MAAPPEVPAPEGPDGGGQSRDYYAASAPITAVGRHAPSLDDLPRDLASLCSVVQGLLVHPFWLAVYGITLRPGGENELQARGVEQMLDQVLAVDPAPFDEARPPERRAVGNCRHFTTLLVALLRHQGVPARGRCGFGAYFEKDRYVDHWVAEVFDADEQRWRLVDPQIDDPQREALRLELDTLDLSPEDFWVAGQAWERCRRGEVEGERFGILDMWGDWFVLGNVALDVASLHRIELLPWDGFGLGLVERTDWTPAVIDLADRAAAATARRPLDLGGLAGLWAREPMLRVPRQIRSHQPTPHDVDVSDLLPEAG